MKLSDFVVDFLVKQNLTHAFGLQGGSVCHLFDSLDKNPKITPIYHHHEQAAAFAAVSYARVTQNFGACFVTTGPGGTNAITGLTGAWLDSIPCIFISGQARVEHNTRGTKLRQLGTQQLDIVPVVSHLTKYAVTIEDPLTIKYHLQKALYLAKHGRPGPVWIDIPLNLQWLDIDPTALKEFTPEQSSEVFDSEKFEKCLSLLQNAKRPLILGGAGIILGKARLEFKELVEKLGIPFITSWAGADLYESSSSLNIGRPGIAGQRGANLAVQNCDLILSVGSHLCIPITGTDYKAFARDAKRIVVDIDENEVASETVKIDLALQSDAKLFLTKLLDKNLKLSVTDDWKKQCTLYKKYNEVPKTWADQKEFVNPYYFMDVISDILRKDDLIVVDGGGNTVYTSYQAARLQQDQRMCLSTGLCAMGSGLPESVGAAMASGSRVICFCGDGSMQLNIQELQTIKHHSIPLKLFILNNGGYLSIRNTQEGFLKANYAGSNAKGGMSLPDFVKIASAYGFDAIRIDNNEDLRRQLPKIMSDDRAIVVELMISPEQEVVPRGGFVENADGSFSPLPLEDMFPRLDRDEFKSLMIVDPLPISLKK